MKNLKHKIALFAAVSIFCISSTTSIMATDYQTPADMVASLTGRTTEDVIQERFDTGKTYGTIAAEAGKLEEFKNEFLNIKENILNENVANGFLSQEEADYILNEIQIRQTICNGTGYGISCGFGNGFGGGRRTNYKQHNNR